MIVINYISNFFSLIPQFHLIEKCVFDKIVLWFIVFAVGQWLGRTWSTIHLDRNRWMVTITISSLCLDTYIFNNNKICGICLLIRLLNIILVSVYQGEGRHILVQSKDHTMMITYQVFVLKSYFFHGLIFLT